MTTASVGPLTIRLVAARDLAVIRAIDAAAFPRPRWRDDVDLDRPDRLHLVACADERVVGFASARVAPGRAEILTVAVDPDHRRRGAGRALVTGLVRALAGRGAEEVTLEVRVGNHAARDLYREVGFVTVGRRPRYYPDGEDALVMWKRGMP